MWKEEPHIVRTSAIFPELTIPLGEFVVGPRLNNLLVSEWSVVTHPVRFLKLVDLPLDVSFSDLRAMGVGTDGIDDIVQLMRRLPRSTRVKPADIKLHYVKMPVLRKWLKERGVETAGRAWVRSDSPKAALRGLFRDRTWHHALDEQPLLREFAVFIIREDLFAAIERWIDRRYIAVF